MTSQKCVKHLSQACTDAQVRAVKTIRLRMEDVQRLLTLDPTVKVILYMRDPRASIMSQLAINQALKVSQEARRRCTEMQNDLVDFELVNKTHPENVIFLRYEDLAMEPQKTVNTVYKFLGQKVPGNVQRWLSKNTQAERSNGPYGTKRNSTQAMNGWRKLIKPNQQSLIEKACLPLMQQLHYS